MTVIVKRSAVLPWWNPQVGETICEISTGRKGRLTGFAPNGHARVKLENDQWRIWPRSKISEPVLSPDERLQSDLRCWIERVGTKRAERAADRLRPYLTGGENCVVFYDDAPR